MNIHVLAIDFRDGIDILIDASSEGVWRQEYEIIKKMWPGCPEVHEYEQACLDYLEMRGWNAVEKVFSLEEVVTQDKDIRAHLRETYRCPYCKTIKTRCLTITPKLAL